MPKAINEKFTYRQRGYLCKICGFTTLTFGSDPEPAICANCGQIGMTKEWDHLVTTQTTVGQFAEEVVAVDPAAPLPAPTPVQDPAVTTNEAPASST